MTKPKPKKTKSSLSPQSVTRQQLRKIRPLLQANGYGLWAVLSALRGPDFASTSVLNVDEVKLATTAVIRWKAFGAAMRRTGAVHSTDNQDAVEVRKKMTKIAMMPEACEYIYHFYMHALRAFAELGLDWDKVNK